MDTLFQHERVLIARPLLDGSEAEPFRPSMLVLAMTGVRRR
jgi:hypothetical protein